MSNFDEIKNDYDTLARLPTDADRKEISAQGYAFERLLKKLFAYDGLEPRGEYKPDGEQIDG